MAPRHDYLTKGWSCEEDCMLMTVFLNIGQPHKTKNKIYVWQDAANEMNEQVAKSGNEARRIYTPMMILSHWKQLQKQSEETLEEEGFDLGDEPRGYVAAGKTNQGVRSMAKKEARSKKYESKSKEVNSKEVEADPWEGLIDPQLLNQ